MELRLKKPSLRTLAQIGTGGLVLTGLGILHTYLYQRRLRETKTYRRALGILYSQEETIKRLGEPIKPGYIKFHDSYDAYRNISIPLTGSNTKGTLYCEFLLTQPNFQPEISKLEIIFSNLPGESFTLYRNEELK